MKGTPQTLKEALYNTIHGSDKSIAAIAEELSISQTYLYKAALPDEGDDATGVKFPLKQLVPLIRATGDFQVLNYIERAFHRIAIPFPITSADPQTIQLDAIKAAAEFGDMMREISVSCGGASLTRKERERIHKEGWEAIEAIMSVIIGCEEGDKCSR
jgi:hypothetical protein